MFAAACAVTLLGCQAGSPVSPSSVTSSAGNVVRPFDYHEDPYPPDPMPSPTPTPPPVPAPSPTPTPTPTPTPNPGVPGPAVPATQRINIVGTFGFYAFDPNPSTAAVGDMIVWANMDTRTHHIMLDSGTDVGLIAPGASTRPMPLATPVANYHCTIHPSMTGTINGSPPPEEEPPPYVYRK